MKAKQEHSTDKCWLEYQEGELVCTYMHDIGEECLMDSKKLW